jgi:hypothetical protein
MTTPFNLASFADKVSSTGTANPSAISDIANTSTGALGFPVGTTAQRNGTPVNGMTRINSTTNVLEVYYNGSWVTISTFTPPGPTVIGQEYGGGYYAGQISTTGNGVATHYLIVAPKSSETSSIAFATSTATDPSSVINGPANSSTMNNASHPAAEYCESLSIGGYTDWYLPAFNELEICYYNLTPFSGNNATNSGINPNAVPPRASNYTVSDPPQTSATIFRAGQSQAFAGSAYWTSTQEDSTAAKYQDFFTGAQNYISKTVSSGRYVRAVRRIPV